MKIAIDARWIFPEISGIGAYTRELLRSLARLDQDNRYLLFFDDAAVRERTLAETGLEENANVSTQLLTYGVFSIRNQIAMPGVLATQGVDVYHSTNYMVPLRAFPRKGRRITSCVATVHDVIPLVFPEYVPRSKKKRLFPLYRWVMVELGRRADAIIAVSQASRADVVKHLAIPRDKQDRVRCVYNGVSERFRPLDRSQDASDDPQRTRTLLYVGRADPYKNLSLLVKALAKARTLCPFPLMLRVAGSPDPRYPEARLLASQLAVEQAIEWTGYLADEELVAAYQEADVLVHPSRYEGFGLQILEAMACGLPVVCSNAASLPEVAGDAALSVAPDDADALTHRITDILTDKALAGRLRQKGIQQAARFTWSETARQTLEVYREAAARRHTE
jgi:glycosyltransferase involved in cell wall biosynthesis